MTVGRTVRGPNPGDTCALSWNDPFCHLTLIRHLLCASQDDKPPIIIILGTLCSHTRLCASLFSYLIPQIPHSSPVQGGCIITPFFRDEKEVLGQGRAGLLTPHCRETLCPPGPAPFGISCFCCGPS